jgi:CHASE1-domain containing sensor protein
MDDIAAAHAYVAAAEQARRQAEHKEAPEKQRVQDQVELAQKNLVAARQRFDAAMSNYRRLGGTIDYPSKLKSY